MASPLLLLDVDGVLSPTRRPTPDWRPHTVVADGVPHRLWLNPRHGPRLLDLARRCGAELVWATPWEHDANVEIAPRIGLPTLPPAS